MAIWPAIVSGILKSGSTGRRNLAYDISDVRFIKAKSANLCGKKHYGNCTSAVTSSFP